ncbi:hypothetical protein HF1_08390 [Mycoplasma haemofelis str. Langford 1]|uniref:Uncharacterized protein n=2 Tax=Mycoplasma haemofelis TaxID=29501 RepID=F6FIX8_MYCHI|nr:hypothetical protein [Mycoplasma haemofelis]AEG73176.1 hypothetical protein MHF_0919 [Mycoplasma haemofelis Ohio2]CBY92847.1 hypothetical protein HF1_08390 [Mycoplasma haemofelis str. Langford 1]
MSSLVSLFKQKQKILILAGCGGIPCGGAYFILSDFLNKTENEKSTNLTTSLNEVQSEIDEQQATKVKRAGVINTVNTKYLTAENNTKQGSNHQFKEENYRLPELESDEKWGQVLQEFQTSKFKNDPRVKGITNIEEVKKYCLDEVSWTESTINLDSLQGYSFSSPEYLCVWDLFKYQITQPT